MRKRWLALAVSAAMALSIGAAGTGPSVAETEREVAAGMRQPYTKILNLAIRDIQDYWSQTLPEVFGIEYEPIPKSRIFAYDETTDDFGECSEPEETYEDNAGNAFYCVLDDFVRYDNQTLFPELYEKYGNNAMALAVVMAHEWGHAIQGRTIPTLEEFAGTPTILKEQQADCFAGAWVEYVDSERSHFGLTLDPGDLDIGVAAMLDVRDQVGSDPTEEGAHGSGFDRVGAFQQGYEGGAAACADLLTNPRQIVQVPFTSAAAALRGGNAPYNEELFDFVRQDLDFYWSQFVELEPYDTVDEIIAYDVDRKRTLPVCKSQGLKPAKPKDYANYVFYCSDTDVIAFDRDLMATVYDETGDFGVATLIANTWASAMQTRLDIRGRAVDVGLQADCFTGSWTGSIPIDEESTASARGLPVDREAGMILEPGDLDEVVQAFLIFADPVDIEEAARGSGFQRISAFRLGFTNGEADCLAITE